MIERVRLVEVGRRSNVCQICTCAKSAHVRARADQKRVRPGFILMGGSSDAGIAIKASHLDIRQVCRAGDPA